MALDWRVPFGGLENDKSDFVVSQRLIDRWSWFKDVRQPGPCGYECHLESRCASGVAGAFTPRVEYVLNDEFLPH